MYIYTYISTYYNTVIRNFLIKKFKTLQNCLKSLLTIELYTHLCYQKKILHLVKYLIQKIRIKIYLPQYKKIISLHKISNSLNWNYFKTNFFLFIKNCLSNNVSFCIDMRIYKLHFFKNIRLRFLIFSIGKRN